MQGPSFDATFANLWYENGYSNPVSISREAVSWFPTLLVGEKEFDMGPIRPRDIKSVCSGKGPIAPQGVMAF